jgi:hypothetical protein
MASDGEVGMSLLERLLERSLQQTGSLDPAARALLRENLRLQLHYPGQYVAYLDRRKGAPARGALTRRVLAHGRSPEEVEAAVAG